LISLVESFYRLDAMMMRRASHEPPTILENIRNFFQALLSLFAAFDPEAARRSQHRESEHTSDS